MTAQINPIFLVNPKSGKLSLQQKLGVINSLDKNFSPEILVPKSKEETCLLSKKLFMNKRTVIACGGDGMASLVAEQATKLNGTMSVLPFGRGNDFAKSVGILSYHGFGKLLKNQKKIKKRILQLEFNDNKRVCLTSVGVGLLSEAAFRASTIPILQGGLLYGLAALLSFVNLKTHNYQIWLDDSKFIAEDLVIAVAASTPYAGGGMRIAPNAEKIDGKFNFLYAERVSRSQAIFLLKKVFSGNHLDHPSVKDDFASSCRINTNSSNFWAPLVYGDGEYLGKLPVKISIKKNRLNLLV